MAVAMASPPPPNDDMPPSVTFIFWLERFFMFGLYLTPCLFPATTSLILPAVTIFLIFAFNWVYLGVDHENEDTYKFLERWARKDRYAFILERCSMFVLLWCFCWIACPHDAVAGYDYKWLVPHLLVFIIFPCTNFMYTPWCPFFQEEETRKTPNLNEKTPTSVHHQYLKCHTNRQTKLRKINPPWKNVVPTVEAKAKHSINLFGINLFGRDSDIPPLEKVEDGNNNALNPAKTHEVSIEEFYKRTLLAAKLQNQDEGKDISHGIALEVALKLTRGSTKLCPSEMFYVKLVKELEASFEKRLKEMCANHEEQKQNWQEERLSLASEIEELEANGKELKRRLEEERLSLASNLEEVEDRNNSNDVLPTKTEEICSEDPIIKHLKAAKTQEFSHGVALETTLKMIYNRDLSNTELFFVNMVKDLEANWEKKLKEKQDMLKEMSEKHEKQNQNWEEERRSFVSELAAAKSRATSYHSLLQYYVNLMEEKNDLAEKLTRATAYCEVYRSLLHNLGASA